MFYIRVKESLNYIIKIRRNIHLTFMCHNFNEPKKNLNRTFSRRLIRNIFRLCYFAKFRAKHGLVWCLSLRESAFIRESYDDYSIHPMHRSYSHIHDLHLFAVNVNKHFQLRKLPVLLTKCGWLKYSQNPCCFWLNTDLLV